MTARIHNPSPPLDDAKELLKKVRRIEIRTSHRVDAVLCGQYHSAFRGRGMEFEEVRPYQPGDDVRTIDWNVTARFGDPFVKVFREDRELTVLLMVDLSASQSIGSRGQRKRELIAELGATLAFSAIRNSDNVGLLGFSDEIEKVVPTRKGRGHVLRLIRELLYCEPVGCGTDIGKAIDHLQKTQKRRAVVFLISDFQDAGKDSYAKKLRVARRKHDIIPVVISDPLEHELPNVGLIELEDVETGKRVLVDTASRRNRANYAAQARRLRQQRDELFRSLNMDAIHLRTDEDVVEPLRKFFFQKQRRQAR
jgi:uncharacterized protein (DUF58 family)